MKVKDFLRHVKELTDQNPEIKDYQMNFSKLIAISKENFEKLSVSKSNMYPEELMDEVDIWADCSFAGILSCPDKQTLSFITLASNLEALEEYKEHFSYSPLNTPMTRENLSNNN